MYEELPVWYVTDVKNVHSYAIRTELLLPGASFQCLHSFFSDKSFHETNNDIHGISISSLQLTVYALHRKTLISTIKFTPRSNVLIIR